MIPTYIIIFIFCIIVLLAAGMSVNNRDRYKIENIKEEERDSDQI